MQRYDLAKINQCKDKLRINLAKLGFFAVDTSPKDNKCDIEQSEHSSMDLKADYCILGGGMIGATLAIGLSSLGYKIILVEAHRPKAYDPADVPDLRVSALNRYTQDLLHRYGVWDKILTMRCKQYKRLSVWEDIEKPLHFDAAEIDESYLGYFVENRILQLALLDTIAQEHADNITVVYAQATHIDVGEARVVLDDASTIQAISLVGADGGNSQLRQAANIGITGWQYEQQANVFLVKMKSGFDAATWQQFTPQGPVAFLPLFDGYANLVWYADSVTSEQIRSGSALDIKKQIVKRFPSILGEFDVVDKTRFGLRRMHANKYWRSNAVLVGDAAHQINPLAGQGVNLGFKDVDALVDSIKLSPITELNKEAFVSYEQARRAANLIMMSAMDVFYQTFSNEFGGIKTIRNLGVKVANVAGPLKQRALKYAMGIK